MCSFYPESKVELKGFMATHYDRLMYIITAGRYPSLMRKAIQSMTIKPNDKILDLGAGTGRNACLMMDYLSTEGELLALDISEEMITQFKKNCADYYNVDIIEKRIDKDIDDSVHKEYYDKVVISFVLHGFPQYARKQIANNAFRTLKMGGELFILDYNEFSIRKMPFYLRIPFRLLECPYAFDFIEMDCKEMLTSEGFNDFSEYLYFSDYVRLLKAMKK